MVISSFQNFRDHHKLRMSFRAALLKENNWDLNDNSIQKLLYACCCQTYHDWHAAFYKVMVVQLRTIFTTSMIESFFYMLVSSHTFSFSFAKRLLEPLLLQCIHIISIYSPGICQFLGGSTWCIFISLGCAKEPHFKFANWSLKKMHVSNSTNTKKYIIHYDFIRCVF